MERALFPSPEPGEGRSLKTWAAMQGQGTVCSRIWDNSQDLVQNENENLFKIKIAQDATAEH